MHGLEYRYVGPDRGGRVTAVAGHAAQPRTFWMGATGGGVWKTDDAGQSWENLSDGFFAVGSIGAIDVADSDPNVIWVGTGSAAIRSNVSTGDGVYRTTDGGETWSHVGLRGAGQIGSLLVHPTDPATAWVAAVGNVFGKNPERGVFRTRDAGATWEKVLFHSDSIGAVDLSMDPRDPDVIYAGLWRAERKPWTVISGADGEGGIYKTTDGGDTWTRLTNGLPQGMIGKISISVAPSLPDRVYALIEAPDSIEGVYRSDDAGATWSLISTQRGLLDRPFYYTYIDADPQNADRVYVNNVAFFRSDDGGRSWQRRRTPHADNHGMWINPDDPRIMIQSNDGGANVSLDGGETWSTQFNQPTAELYQVDLDDRFPYWLYAGQQDNTTIGVPSVELGHPAGDIGNWREVGGCETGPVVPKPGSNGTIVYANCKGRFGRYSELTGQEKQYYVGAANMYGHNPKDLQYRFQRVSPIVVSPHDPGIVYHASQYLHRTRDEGVTWEIISPDLTANDPRGHVISGQPITRDITGEEFYSTIYTVAESPITPGLIWTGSNDGIVSVTRDHGATWSNVTPPELPQGGRVQTVEASPHDPAKAYVAVLRYMFDDWEPYIYRTNDYGATWTRITAGIPADHPTRVVREDPEREGLLYAGTEFAAFVSFDDGASWQPLQRNLPAVPVTDMKVYRGDLVLATQGRGFWIMDDLSALRQWTPAVAADDAHLFTPAPAYRTRDGARGARLYLWLADAPQGEVTVEVLNAGGDEINEFSRSARAGLNRLVWDLSWPGAWSERGGPSRGPLAVPGEYRVRITSAGTTLEAPLTLRIDPRVEADGVTVADLREQLDISLEIRDALSRARQLVARVEDLRGQTRGAELRRLEAVHAALVTADETYPQPMLVDQLSYLYSMLQRADQKPGRDAYTRLAELRGALEGLEAAVSAVSDSRRGR